MAGRAAAEVFGSTGLRRWLEPAVVAVLLAAVVMTAGALGTSRLEYVATWWVQRLLPSGVPPSNAAVAVAPAAPVATVAVPPRPGVARVLDATTPDRDAAFAKLFARWGIDFQAGPGESACDLARRAGLRCLVRSGTWNVIRRLDVPAMLTLTTPTGDRHYATVAALGADAVTLDAAPRPVTLPLSEVERFWDGAFVALWRAPDLAATELKPGDDLKRRVVAFQRANGLRADGVVGEETLLRLAATTAGGRPSLSKATP
jgi:general secretion pathway protein A